MAAKKKGPGGCDAGTLKNCTTKLVKRTKKRRAKQIKPFQPRREYWLYSGVVMLATLIVNCRGETRAFGADRKSLGLFPTLHAATTAIGCRGGVA
jgi:hypothetical protein